ncbi:DUF5683 domain-containing protein [Salibacteraceae bacterium]|nr:DUF5683 domain-containing protein [Salibacteraceae bacterium]
MRFLFIISLLISAVFCNAQSDSSNAKLPHKLDADTLVSSESDTGFIARPTERNPRRATILSALAPGLGQAYNKKYWKMPIVYAGLGTAGFFFFNNRRFYNEFKDAYIQDVNIGDGDVSKYYDLGYTKTDIQSAAEQYQTWMEYSAVAFLAVYVLQIVDASVDAHLYYFDVSDDLSLNVSPTIQYTPNYRPVNSLGLQLTF